MESKPILYDIIAKIDNLLQIMNSSNQISKRSIPYVISTVREIKKSLITIRTITLKRTFSRLVQQLSATNVQIIGMLLPTIQTHLRLSLMTEFPFKHLSLIVLFSESHSCD